MKNHKKKQVDGEGIAGVIQIRYYSDKTALVSITGEGELQMTAEKAKLFYRKNYKKAA